MKKYFVHITTTFFIFTLSAMASSRFVEKIKIPSGLMVVVSEGEFEARSIGSFSIRLYQAASKGNETTFFTNGVIRNRDGFIEKVVLSDVNGDDQPEVIVIIRSVGTGNYLSAYAFTINKHQELVLISNVEGLQSKTDPIVVLKKSKLK